MSKVRHFIGDGHAHLTNVDLGLIVGFFMGILLLAIIVAVLLYIKLRRERSAKKIDNDNQA